MGCGALDVVVFSLPGPRFGGQDAATVDLGEVTIGKLVVAFGVGLLVIVNGQVPQRILVEAVLFDEAVLLGG